MDFWLVYIKEAHPIDGWRPNPNVKIEQPKTYDERTDVAGQCIEDLALSIPVLVDDMDDTVSKAYNAMPDRLFILAADGTIAYRGDRGPRGFDVEEMEKALIAHLATDG